MPHPALLSLAILALAAHVCAGASAAATCTPPPPDALRAAWQGFRVAALAGDPVRVAAFHRFPLKLLSPYHDVKPFPIPRAAFLHNYEALFRNGPADTEVGLYTDLKKTTGREHIGTYLFDSTRCTATARVEDYEFTYRHEGGWKIESIFYGGDFDVAREMRLDRIDD